MCPIPDPNLSDSGRLFEAAVIGGGPAGLAAATWLGRYRCRTVLFDSGEPRNRWTEQVHGYLGLDPISPADLIERGRRSLRDYESVETIAQCIVDIESTEGVFELRPESGSGFRTLRIILATGVVDDFPDIQGFLTHYGADVFHCPDCDGYEARGRNVVVLGMAHVENLAAKMRNWAASVVAVVPMQAKVDPSLQEQLEGLGVRFIVGEVESFSGERGELKGLHLQSGEFVEADLAFFSSSESHKGGLADVLGCRRTEEGCIWVDAEGQTSTPGVYAAGDITPGEHLVQIAAAKGAIAGISCARSLRDRQA